MLRLISWAFAPARRGTSLLVVAFLVTLAAIGIARWQAGEAKEARKEAETARVDLEVVQEARRADEAALGTRDTIQDRINENEVVRSAETEDALRRNAEWADQPVPADVLDSLRY